MKDLLEKICAIENVKGVWLFSKKKLLEKQNIPLDVDIKNKLVELFDKILNFVKAQIKTKEIECMFNYDFFMFKKVNEDTWLVIWAKSGDFTSLIRMEVDVVLQERLNKKKFFKIKFWE